MSDEEIAVGRYASAGLQVIAGILGIVSVFTVWFYMSGGGVALQFFPGSSYKANGVSRTYAAGGLGPVGGLYDAVLVLALVGGALLLLGGLLALVARVRRQELRSGRVFGVALSGLMVMAVGWVICPAIQPWALHQSAASFCSGWTGISPCSRPWGSGTQGGISYTFFTADGWIIMLGGIVLGVLGQVIGRLSRNPS